MNGKIFQKIDAFSAVFQEVSIQDVLESIGFVEVMNTDYTAVFAQRFLTSLGYATDLRFNFDGVGIQLRYPEVLEKFGSVKDLDDLEDPSVVFTTKFSFIRFDAMGQALDMLRSLDIDVDQKMTHALILPNGGFYHVTRIDFAYDFINYMPNFVDDVIQLCNRFGDDMSRRVPVKGSKCGLAYSIRTGDQKTVYLGKGSGNRCLRIYDKGLQFRSSNVSLSDYPYKDEDGNIPKSWFRIELQLRREDTCHQFLFGDLSDHGGDRFMSVLREIYEYYAIRLGQGQNVPVAPVWLQLWDWETIPRIIQNANCVSPVDVYERSRVYLCKVASLSVFTVASRLGWNGFVSEMKKLMSDIQHSDSPSAAFRRNKLQARLYDKFILPEKVFIENGEYKIKD